MANCLVVGANGFIASYLVDELLAQGHSVTAFDRFSRGQRIWQRAGAREVTGDFMNRADIAAAMHGQDFVFHFLSTTTPATSEEDPTLDIRTNVAQTVEMLELASEAGIQKFYFASTGGAIYGDQGHAVYRETDGLFPISPYAIGKLTIENYLRYFKAKRGLEYVVLRISNPYGPRQSPSRKQGLIPIVLRQLEDGKPVTQFGDGSMVRDYLYVEDVASMIASTVGMETRHDTYNIGSGQGHSVTQVLNVIRNVTGCEFEIQLKAVPSTYITNVVLSTDRFNEEFGYVKMTSLEEGIRRTWVTDRYSSVLVGSL